MYDKLINLIKETRPDISSDVHPVGRYKNPDDNGGECVWYYDFKTGMVYSNSKNDSNDGNFFNRRQAYHFFSLGFGFHWFFMGVYYPETDIGGIHRMRIDCSIPEKGEFREPELVDSLWINRKKETVYQDSNMMKPILLKEDLFNFIAPYTSDFMYDLDKNMSSMLMRLFRQESPCFYFSESNKEIIVNDTWTLCEFLFQKETQREKGNDQKTIDRLCKNMYSYKWDNYEHDFTRKGSMIFVMEKIETGCVMRGFVTLPCNQCFLPEERYRIFFMEDRTICARKNCQQEFVVMKDFPEYDSSFMMLFNEEIIKGTVLGNISNYLGLCNTYNIANLIFAVQKNPIIEKMLKADMSDYVVTALLSSVNWQMLISNVYSLVQIGDGDNKEGDDFDKIIGLAYWQRKKLFDRFPVCFTYMLAEESNPLKDIKKLLGEKASSTDMETFQEVLDLYSLILKSCGSRHEISNTCITVQDIFKECSFNMIKKKRVLEYIINLAGHMGSDWFTGTDFSSVLIEYRDYLQMRREIYAGGGKKFPLMPRDIIREHFAIVEYYKKRKAEIDKNNFLRHAEKCKKYTYEDGEYVVIVPRDSDDIHREGDRLHHCVGSYASRVAGGSTNIVFIRKVKEPEKPFFTAEITNEGYLRQIHGLKNRNISTEPDLVPFVKKWISEKNLRAGNYNGIY